MSVLEPQSGPREPTQPLAVASGTGSSCRYLGGGTLNRVRPIPRFPAQTRPRGAGCLSGCSGRRSELRLCVPARSPVSDSLKGDVRTQRPPILFPRLKGPH